MDRNKAYLAAAAAGIPLLFVLWRSRKPSHPPLPPGPPRDPIIGSVRSFPASRWYESFSEMQKKYGDLIYFDILGTRMLIVNSLGVAKDLMEKRGTIYSGRPNDVMNYTVMGWSWNFVLAQLGQFHTDCRAIIKKAIGQQEMEAHRDLIQEEARNLIPALTHFEGDPWEIIQPRIGAVTIRLTYGDSVHQEYGKELAKLNEDTLHLVTSVSVQFWLVNFIPALHYLPDWLPLAFKKVGKEGTALQERMHYWGWELTEKHHKQGIAGPSIALQYIEEGKNADIARDVLGMVYSAGVDNTASTLESFISMMLLHPDVQKKAQVELDRVIQPGVLPEFGDREALPYLDATWRESQRLNPSTPLGVPHLASEADVYKGMYIPKGTVLTTNIGYMCRDPTIWDEPDVFRPERWLPSHNPNAHSLPDISFVFGFGRRICPGMFLADQVAFTFAAAILQAYDIVPIAGDTLPKEYLYKDSLMRRPEGLRCRFLPRNALPSRGEYY
ncbi:hypothetical protein M408DRAFT_328406 [Serendipita vermifera MAFF 305830]|uniref:Cytochrome P450 n=1 Tax=Serendipita vermifera MAFF 305830 TaxID=933852 RepID=A0A0C3BCU0_SERVB|nr:hypothetical protein M408DRAFT_328406 [Serendipita vermifera MAFF 305830]